LFLISIVLSGCPEASPAQAEPEPAGPDCHWHFEARDEGQFVDDDGDGFAECELDCDDEDSTAHPGAPEVPYDGIDQDCDGSDAPSLDVLAGAPLFRSTVQAPWLIVAAADLNGDGRDDVILSREGPESPVDVYFGPVDGPDPGPPQATVRIEAGWGPSRVVPVGDLDGDGTVDLLLIPRGDSVWAGDGSVCTVWGPVMGEMVVGPAACVTPASVGLSWIRAAFPIADANGDLEPDLAIAGIDEAGPLLRLVAGGDAFRGLQNSFSTVRTGGAEVEAVVVADFTRDGLPDLLVGEPRDQGRGRSAGVARLYQGPLTEDATPDDAWATLHAENDWNIAGQVVAGSSDLDGDGWVDIVVAAPWGGPLDRREGRIYAFLEPPSGSVELADADIQVTGENVSDYTGMSLVEVGDLDGDGADELVVGTAPACLGCDGRIYYTGRLPEGRSVTMTSPSMVSTQEYRDAFGMVVPLGDVDGDGVTDLMALATRQHDETTGRVLGSHVSRAWLIYGTGWRP